MTPITLYKSLEEVGYTLIFKPVLQHTVVKGNVDADLVLQAMIDFTEYDKAVIVSSDGDYASLVKFLISKQKLEIILSPAKAKKCSILLKRTGSKISYIDDQKNLLSR